jgi:hypothetical protein
MKEDGCVFFFVWITTIIEVRKKGSLFLQPKKVISMEEVWNMEHTMEYGPKKNSVAST